MTTFVVLAAGRGTRSRPGIHKALLPVDGRAVLSHQIDLAPPGSSLVVAVGHQGRQIRDYLRLAHPGLAVTFVEVSGYDRPGAGPGASLAACADVVGSDDLVFTTCDTLWDRDDSLWDVRVSWAAVAAVPEGTAPERWCRIVPGVGVFDKQPGGDGWVWTGLARIRSSDLAAFWKGIASAGLVDGERQLSGGLGAVDLDTVKIGWTDVGDVASYRQAVGYDSAKLGTATFVLPGRVVKYWADPVIAQQRRQRAVPLAGLVPPVAGWGPGMFAYDLVEGVTGYEAVEADVDMIDRIYGWAESDLWEPWDVPGRLVADACDAFYRAKTYSRVRLLAPELREVCHKRLGRVDWDHLAGGALPSRFHGDLNLGNVIVGRDGRIVGIDWREGFAGYGWGDRRYDQAKLLTSTVVHWGRAARGDFALWDAGPEVRSRLRQHIGDRSVETIAALCLLNSAPLHQPPADQVLVARGVAWLDETFE